MKQLNISTFTVTVIFLLTSFFVTMPEQLRAADNLQVDILYMNHGPMRPTVAKIKKLLAGFGDKVEASWYDFETTAGKAYMKKEKISGHIPLLIRIAGQSNFIIDGREVKLRGFPTGAAPFKRVEGNWSLDDLKQLIEQRVR